MRKIGRVNARRMTRAELLRAVENVDVLVVRIDTKVNAELLRRAKHLKCVVSATTGLNHIDTAFLKKRGIPLFSLSGAHSVPTAEHALALLFSAARRIPWANAHMARGRWKRWEFMGTELAGKTLGILGIGRVGTQLAKRSRALAMDVIACDPYVSAREVKTRGAQKVNWSTFLRRSDFISLHAPLTVETKNLFGRKEFAAMKPSMIFINTARGAIIEERALLSVLSQNRIRAAALDVYPEEPLALLSPLRHYAHTHENLILTPHIAASTHEAVGRVSMHSAEMIKKFFAVFLVGALMCASWVSFTNAAVKSQPKPKPHQYTRIFYYRDGKSARASFFAHPKSMDVFAPQSYSLDADGVLAGGIDSKLLSFAAKNKIKVMPLVTNKAFNQDDGHALLDDPAKQDAAISALVAEGLKQKYWGWQFDFEQMDGSYRDRYSTFIKKAGEAFKQNNLTSSVAVIAQISEDPNDYPNNLWQRVIGVYDYAALSSSVDFVSIMTYDDPESKGPVARYSWVKKVIENSLKNIPKEKISLGIPLYYWKWDDARGKLVGIGGYEGIKNVLKKYGVAPRYSVKERARYIKYTVKKKHYTIWYENAQSIQKKLALITQNKLHGFSAWALGLEVPGIHDAVKR